LPAQGEQPEDAGAQDADAAKPATQLQSAGVPASLIKSDARVDRGSLETVVDRALAKARELLKYYPWNASKMGKVSRRFGRAAVILGVLGGLCPLLPAGLVEDLPGDLKAMISPLGFVLFALAVGGSCWTRRSAIRQHGCEADLRKPS